MSLLARQLRPAALRPLAHSSRIIHGAPRRGQASTATDGPAVTATNRAEATLKRFWTTVGVAAAPGGDGWAVTLDGRALKTPGGAPLRVPARKRLAAALVAAEWENQTTLLRPHTLPMTSLVSRAIDAMHTEPSRAEVRATLLKYVDNDTVFFPADEPEPLVRLQQEHWDPLLDWARSSLGLTLEPSTGLIPTPQPASTVATLDALLAGMSPWELAAMERATYAAKSVLVGLALVRGRLSAEAAARVAQVEVDSQIERWGQVEDTHDVDYEDVRRQLGSAAVLLADC